MISAGRSSIPKSQPLRGFAGGIVLPPTKFVTIHPSTQIISTGSIGVREGSHAIERRARSGIIIPVEEIFPVSSLFSPRVVMATGGGMDGGSFSPPPNGSSGDGDGPSIDLKRLGPALGVKTSEALNIAERGTRAALRYIKENGITKQKLLYVMAFRCAQCDPIGLAESIHEFGLESEEQRSNVARRVILKDVRAFFENVERFEIYNDELLAGLGRTAAMVDAVLTEQLASHLGIRNPKLADEVRQAAIFHQGGSFGFSRRDMLKNPLRRR